MSSDESLFREVDEDVRAEELAKLWKRYSSTIIAVSLAIILGVSGLKGWDYWQLTQSEAAAREYVAALKLETDGKPAEAAKAFATMEQSGAGFAAIARLRAAALLAETGDTDGAVKAYDAVATIATPELADAARVRAAWLLVDKATPADLETRLSTLNVAGNAWRNAAREILGLAWYKAGDFAKADTLFGELVADQDAPANARSRAQMLQQLIAPRLSAKSAG